MSFATPIFLGALAAVSIPIIIHLIYRLRKRQVIFGTLRFLKVVQKKNARMLRIRELLLLLLRIGVIVCVVLAFARPFFPGSEVEAEVLEGSADMVLVLDDTFSMGVEVHGKSRFEHAKDRIVTHIKRLKQTDRVGLVCLSDPHRMRLKLTSQVSEFVSQLRGQAVPLTDGGGEIVPALKTASRALAPDNSSAAIRIVVVVSDLQKAAWDPATFATEKEAQIAGVHYEVVALPGTPENLAVVDTRVLSTIFIAGSPVPVAAQVAGFGKSDQKRLVVTLRQFDRPADPADKGRPVAQRSIDVAAGGIAKLVLRATMAGAGEAAGLVQIEGRDPLPGDDRHYWAVNLRERIKVLCVEDSLAAGVLRYRNETYFLRQALDPHAGEDDEPRERSSYITTRAIPAGELSDADLRWADVVALCSVSWLSDAQTRSLIRWVDGGGGLMVFVGGADRADRDRAPSQAFYEGPIFQEGVLPARPLAPEGRVDALDKFRRISQFDPEHFLFKPFQGDHASDLMRPRFYRYYRFRDEDLARKAVKVLARLDEDRPLILEKSHGKGRTLLFATSAAAKWSDLPKRKVYVPLLHQSVRYLTRSRAGPPKQFLVGETLKFGIAAGDDQAFLALTTPDGDRIDLSPGDPVVARHPGIYALASRRGGFTARRYVAVNVPPSESDLNGYSPAEVAAAFETGRVDDPSKVRTMKIGDDSSDELKRMATDWRHWLMAALALLVVEALIANVLLRPR